MAVVELTSGESLENVVSKNGITIVDFYATWCGPCKMLNPILKDIDSQNSNVDVVKINFEDHIDLAQEYSVMSVPKLIIFKNGKVIDEINGALPKALLEKRIGVVESTI